MASAAISAPPSAPRGGHAGDAVSSMTMQNTAAALAPASMPMMSGLASGLRARLWKIAPEMPNATPTSRPVSARGSRSVRTMNSASSVAAAEHRRHHVAQRDREVADADRHAERREDQRATSTSDDRPSSGSTPAVTGLDAVAGRPDDARASGRRARSSVTAPPACGGGPGR